MIKPTRCPFCNSDKTEFPSPPQGLDDVVVRCKTCHGRWTVGYIHDESERRETSFNRFIRETMPHKKPPLCTDYEMRLDGPLAGCSEIFNIKVWSIIQDKKDVHEEVDETIESGKEQE